jgi:hypothetical protein
MRVAVGTVLRWDNTAMSVYCAAFRVWVAVVKDSPPILGKDSGSFAEQPASYAFQHDQWLLNEAARS